jgi:glycerol kinase
MTRSADLLLAIDQGTSSTRAIVFDRSLRAVASATRPLATHHPQPGWVEQDPSDLVETVVQSVSEVLEQVGGTTRILAAGLANQGESVAAWDAETLQPLAPVISWQCRRSQVIVERLRAAGHADGIRARSGLPLDPYFSAGKAAWLIEHNPAVAHGAVNGTLRLGTVDAWLTATLGDRGAITDPSTASRTQLLSLRTVTWDPQLLDWFGIEQQTLPAIVPTAGDAGTLGHRRWGGRVPLFALACDQQAALAGHGAFTAGATKATFGTGVFVLANSGLRTGPADGLETSIAWELPSGTRANVLQGGVFAAGALVDWLRDGLGVIASVEEAERAARRAHADHRVRVLPALVGLGSPFYDHAARAIIAGLGAATTRDDLVAAALDGIAHRTADVVEAMIEATGEFPASLRVDGGLTANRYLMQRQADLLGFPVDVAAALESTALGIAGLAGMGLGWIEAPEIGAANPVRHRYDAHAASERAAERAAWQDFVRDARVLRGNRDDPTP